MTTSIGIINDIYCIKPDLNMTQVSDIWAIVALVFMLVIFKTICVTFHLQNFDIFFTEKCRHKDVALLVAYTACCCHNLNGSLL